MCCSKVLFFCLCLKLELDCGQTVNISALCYPAGCIGVRQGTLYLENCVLQCETTGVIVRTSARLTMNICDVYGSKVRVTEGCTHTKVTGVHALPLSIVLVP